jgi:hypothetical protein
MSDDDYYYETTPYGVEQRGKKWAVRQCWWGKDISLHKTREEADEACIAEARRTGCLTRHRLRPIKKAAAKKKVAKRKKAAR